MKVRQGPSALLWESLSSNLELIGWLHWLRTVVSVTLQPGAGAPDVHPSIRLLGDCWGIIFKFSCLSMHKYFVHWAFCPGPCYWFLESSWLVCYWKCHSEVASWLTNTEAFTTYFIQPSLGNLQGISRHNPTSISWGHTINVEENSGKWHGGSESRHWERFQPLFFFF